jgi:hypothetical protein
MWAVVSTLFVASIFMSEVCRIIVHVYIWGCVEGKALAWTGHIGKVDREILSNNNF